MIFAVQMQLISMNHCFHLGHENLYAEQTPTLCLPPPGRNPENASAPVGVVSGSEIDPTRLVEALSSFYGNVLVNAYFHGTVRLF